MGNYANAKYPALNTFEKMKSFLVNLLKKTIEIDK